MKIKTFLFRCWELYDMGPVDFLMRFLAWHLPRKAMPYMICRIAHENWSDIYDRGHLYDKAKVKGDFNIYNLMKNYGYE